MGIKEKEKQTRHHGCPVTKNLRARFHGAQQKRQRRGAFQYPEKTIKHASVKTERRLRQKVAAENGEAMSHLGEGEKRAQRNRKKGGR